MIVRNTKRPWTDVVVVAGILLVFTAVVYPVLFQTRGRGGPLCLRAVKGLATALATYEADADGTLPLGAGPAGPTAVGWGARISPYVKTPEAFADPQEGSGGPVAYAMNANAAEIPRIGEASDPARSVLLFEVAETPLGRGGGFPSRLARSAAGDGAAGGLLDSSDPAVPPSTAYATGPLANSGLPSDAPTRHGAVSTFAFRDSHARMLRPEAVGAGANAGRASDPERPSGCARPDLTGVGRPCAEGAAGRARAATFSLR